MSFGSRRSSTRILPRKAVGKSGSIFAHHSSDYQNKFRLMCLSESEEANHQIMETARVLSIFGSRHGRWRRNNSGASRRRLRDARTKAMLGARLGFYPLGLTIVQYQKQRCHLTSDHPAFPRLARPNTNRPDRQSSRSSSRKIVFRRTARKPFVNRSWA